MIPEAVRSTVTRILTAEFSVPPEDSSVGTATMSDLGLDSLAVFELLVLIEDELSVVVDDRVLTQPPTIDDIVAAVMPEEPSEPNAHRT